MSSGIPDLERFITDHILQALVFRFLLPSLQRQSTDLHLSVTTSMYLLCCILHILKNKDMASTVAAALFHQTDCPDETKQGSPPDGYTSEHDNCKSENHCSTASAVEQSNEDEPNSVSSVSWKCLPNHSPPSDCCQGNTPREHLLSYITQGDDSQALGSLCLFATLLQTKELDESMLDALGILPQRKQHKKLLLQALVGEDLAEGQLFSSSSGLIDDSIHSDFDIYARKLQDKYGLQCHHPRLMSSKAHRYQVLDALADLFCRSKVSAYVRLVGGWLFRQLLPHGEEEFTAFHLRRLKDSHKDCSSKLSKESGGCWCDMLLPIIKEAWRNCKKEIEASSVAIAEGVYDMVKHCILASCRITKDDEDCREESPPNKYLEYPSCISKDIETFCWCKQPMGEEEINTSRMEEYSHSYTEPLMLIDDTKRGCRRETFSSYKLQLLTMLNNCYKLQQLNMLNT
jgi:protein CLEC16A